MNKTIKQKYPEEWRKHFQQQFSTKELDLYKLAKWYHDECEAYEQIICSFKNNEGKAMPVNRAEFIMINQNAKKIRKECIRKGTGKGFKKEEIEQAIKYFGRGNVTISV